MRPHEQPREATGPNPVRRPPRSGPVPALNPRRGGLSPSELLALQRTAGNSAVARALQNEQHTHDASCGHGAEPVQRSAVHEVLRSAGQPLNEPIRTEMEARLGADFSDVRLHTGTLAQRSAAEVGARAYTSGSHVVIGQSGTDKHTLAHELTHVIQQRQGPVAGTDNGNGLRVSDPSDRFERAAEANATRVLSRSVTLPSLGRITESSYASENSLHRADGISLQRLEGLVEPRSMDWTIKTSGNGKVSDSQFTHGVEHSFTSPSGEQIKHDPDAWMNRKKFASNLQWRGHSTISQAVESAAEDYFVFSDRTTALEQLVSQQIGGEESLLDPAITVLATPYRNRPWESREGLHEALESSPPLTMGLRGTTDKATARHQATLAAHLISLRATITARQSVMDMLSPKGITVESQTAGTAIAEVLPADWAKLRHIGRKWVKQQLLEGVTPPDPNKLKDEMNEELFAALTEDRGLFHGLHQRRLITVQHGNTKIDRLRKIGSTTNSLNETDETNVKHAFNHLRFLLYTEWRAVHELIPPPVRS
jgi:hypothetical protein